MKLYTQENDKTTHTYNHRVMTFIMNAIEDGWTVFKEDDTYIFRKKHENKKEVFHREYLQEFLVKHIDASL
jgi:5-methylthioribose kinase|tara:strand:+ start:1297 stop:1509 length:213 start_codon:yes stop_codon:yes gene_type:complete